MIEKRYYSIKETADLLNVSDYRLRYWLKNSSLNLVNRLGQSFCEIQHIEYFRRLKYLLEERGYTLKVALETLKLGSKGINADSFDLALILSKIKHIIFSLEKITTDDGA